MRQGTKAAIDSLADVLPDLMKGNYYRAGKRIDDKVRSLSLLGADSSSLGSGEVQPSVQQLRPLLPNPKGQDGLHHALAQTLYNILEGHYKKKQSISKQHILTTLQQIVRTTTTADGILEKCTQQLPTLYQSQHLQTKESLEVLRQLLRQQVQRAVKRQTRRIRQDHRKQYGTFTVTNGEQKKS